MAQLRILTDSLHGRALYIRNLLRGGISTDDDSYPLSMLRASIVNVSAAVLQAELDKRFQLGQELDNDLLTIDPLPLHKYEVTPESPVVFLYADRPHCLQWNGDAAIKYLKAKEAPAEWAVATGESDAIRKATGQAYEPGQPAYWFNGNIIRFAIPLSMGLLRSVEIGYVPAQLDTYTDGQKRDLYTDEFPLPPRLWEVVWKEVFRNQGGNLIQTSTNRDETNNGADNTVQPRQ